ncbi:sigma-54-dependent Fis family transcriptional regulator [bacterium]|nr:sigma-54-dependent Fis family transcriptional regulator [bacterium]
MSDKTGLLTSHRIMEIGRKLLELRPQGEVLEAVISSAAEAMHAETALMLLREKSTGELSVAAQQFHGDGEPRALDEISQSLLNEAFEKREPVFTESAVEDPRFSGKASVILHHIQAAVVVPLVGEQEIEGAIYLDSRSDRTRFRRENLAPLSTLAAFSSLAIANARRYDSAQREIEHLKQSREKGRGALVGSSVAMQELYSMIDRVAQSQLPVFITGESGTGKELVAREIHNASARATKPFFALYCGNVSPELFESELFGHKKGAFTGAVTDKSGLVQVASGGTLFLDEIADIPINMQAKLLRFLQNSEYRAVGDTIVRRADVRILAATNKNITKEIAENRFREDLYYRLYILPVEVSPLRERLSDIPFLVRHFLDRKGESEGGPSGISQAALRTLMSYSWPGNIRELENTIARARVVARGDRIEATDIVHHNIKIEPKQEKDLSWKAAERRHVLEVLSICEGNKSRAAKILGISRRYLHYKLKEWA